MRVLVTRPKTEAERTARLLKRLGYEALVAPLLTIIPNPPERLIRDAMPDALLITSGNALRAIAGHPDHARLVRIPVLAVGSRTARMAERQGFRNVREAGGDAQSLLRLAANCLTAGMRALHLSGHDLARDLAPCLAERGVTVDRIEVYRAEAVKRLRPAARNALRHGAIDAVLHFSPRSARLFADHIKAEGLVEQMRPLRHLCLSQNVAQALEPLDPEDVLIAERPCEATLLALLSTGVSP